MAAPRVVTLFALLLLAGPLPAQPGTAARLRGESEAVRTRKRLTEAQQKLTDGKPADAADDLQKVLDESGDDLVLVKDNNFQPARRLAQQYLAALPPAALAPFRGRIDEPARRLLDAGKKARDPKPLRELTDRYFVSRPAEEGLLLLGELAFERGEFDAAVRHWSALLPGDPAADLKYPDPKTPPAAVRAKVLLARLFRGDGERAADDVAKFAADHPDARGRLAGADGKYADTLARLLKSPPAVPSDASGWTTFAGTPARDGRPAAPLPRYWAPRPTWATPIPRLRGDPDKPKPAASHAARTLAFHPVVLNGVAYLADAGRVYQFDLKAGTARLAFHYEALGARLEFVSDRDKLGLAVPCLADADFTLTVGDGRLYARVGPTALPDGSEQDAKSRTYLVCLEPKTGRKVAADELTLVPRWHLAPPAADGTAAWEGAPAFAGGRLYAAFVRAENNRLVHAVACYADAAPGKPLWVADVCDTDANRAAGGKHRHEVLAVAGGHVLFASHTGLTVALDAGTGKPAWAFRNPPPARPWPAAHADLCPPLAAGDTVFVAPADGDGVYALAADTGRPRWSAAGIQVEHLLGVSRGKLVATVSAPVKGVRGFDVATGDTREPAGWVQHDSTDVGSYGRGLVGDDLIVWPTATTLGGSLQFLNPADGTVARLPVAGPHGNLAYADGVVLVATPTHLCGYVFDGPADPRPVPPPPRPFAVTAKPPAFDAASVLSKPPDDAVTAPNLAAPAKVTRAVKVPAGAWPLLPLGDPTDARFALCDGRRLHRGDAGTGKIAWSVELDPPAALTLAAFTADDRLIAVGPHAVVAVSADGRMAWDYRVPDTAPRPELSAPAFAGNRLVVRLGDNTLLALDTDTGKPAWVRDVFGRPRSGGLGMTAAPRFGPHLAVTPAAVVAHRSDGVRLTFHPGDGSPVGDAKPSSLVEWPGSPAAVPSSDRAVVLPTSATAVAALDPGDDTELWRFDAGRDVSAAGTPPQVRTFGDSGVVAVARNYGTELHLLTAADGGSTWSRPAVLPAADVDLTGVAADREHLFVPTADRLHAVTRDTGREAWATPLPALADGARWAVRAGKRAVIAHPVTAVPEEPWATTAGRVARRVAEFPSPVRVLGGGLTLLETGAIRTLPVLLFDPDTGRLEQRLDVPAVGPTVRVVLTADTAAVLTAGRVVWLKNE